MDNLAYEHYEEPTQSSGSEFVDNKARGLIETIASNDDPIDGINKPHLVFAIDIDGEFKQLNDILELTLRYEGGYYFSENKVLNISGNGESAREAIKNAVFDISYFYKYYQSLGADELIGNGLELKRIYSQIL